MSLDQVSAAPPPVKAQHVIGIAGRMLRAISVPVVAILCALLLFGVFILLVGRDPIAVYATIYKGAFGSWFSWQNTLVRAAPLMLTALCTAIPARLGLIIIGGEGAFVIGAVSTVLASAVLSSFDPAIVIMGMAIAGMAGGGAWIGLVGVLRRFRGVNETISSLLLNYIAIAIMNHLVNGPIRDLEVVHRPSSWAIGDANMLANIPNMDVHWGLSVGIVACLLMYVLMSLTTFGFASRVIGGNMRAAQVVGLPVSTLVVIACILGGSAAGLAGMVEVASVQGRVSSSIIANYGYTGILVAFIARHNPLAIIPTAILLGGISASGGLLQRWHELPDATVAVLQGIMFIMILAGDPLYAAITRVLRRQHSA